MVNYLLFPDARQAWQAASDAFLKSRDSEAWDDIVAFRVSVCIHRGSVKVLDDHFGGPGIEVLDRLIGLEASDNNIIVSSEAGDEISGVTELKKGYDSQAGAFYIAKASASPAGNQ